MSGRPPQSSLPEVAESTLFLDISSGSGILPTSSVTFPLEIIIDPVTSAIIDVVTSTTVSGNITPPESENHLVFASPNSPIGAPVDGSQSNSQSNTVTRGSSSTSQNSESPSNSRSSSETPGTLRRPSISMSVPSSTSTLSGTPLPSGQPISATLSKGTVIGIAVGSVALAIVFFFVGFCIHRRKAAKSARKRRVSRFDAVPYYAAGGSTSIQQRHPGEGFGSDPDAHALPPPSYATVVNLNLQHPNLVTSKRAAAQVDTMAGEEVGVTYQRKPVLVRIPEAENSEIRKRRMSL
ncbi:hypothetical protein BKA70DRAFT_1223787 [Coprinopsis sp. MPI-PUGE-AT-0042]|nr:hypothetical protein BKA70DRAFT_1223787 [Coprinopsis sp. MPI-PUGE-AT-0042]